jgi:hypothetical protein
MGQKTEIAQQVSSTVQNIAVTIPAVIGGCWALHTYIYEHPSFYEKGGELVNIPV